MIDWSDVDVPRMPEPIEIRTMDEALEWGDGWKRAFYRLESEHCRTVWRVEYYETLLRYLDPYLPRWLQDETLRAANEPLYETLADSRRDDAL